MVVQSTVGINSSLSLLVRHPISFYLHCSANVIGHSVGLIDWKVPKKLGGKAERRIDVGGSVADVCWSQIDTGLLGVVTSSGVL